MFLLLTAAGLRAEDSSYRESLRNLRDRCSELEAEASDYRKPEPRLTPEKEQELFRLQGQLLRDDPVGTLSNQISADRLTPNRKDSRADASAPTSTRSRGA